MRGFFVSATLDLLCCSTEFPETIYRINIHYVDVHITRNVRFHKFSGNSHSALLSFIGCNHYSYDQFVSGPLKLLHRISKTLYGIWKSFFANICTSAFKILLLLKTKVLMCIFAKSSGLITFEEYCPFFSIFNAYLSLQTTANIYDHLPIWKKQRTVAWDNDAYHAIHAFSPKLIVCVYSYLKIYWNHYSFKKFSVMC